MHGLSFSRACQNSMAKLLTLRPISDMVALYLLFHLFWLKFINHNLMCNLNESLLGIL